MFFPIVLFGKSKLYMIPVYKISKSNIKQHLKKEIRKAYEYYNNEKNGIYYGILTTDLINAEEKKYWKERCDKAQNKFFDMIKAEELKEIFDLFAALGKPHYYWEHSLGHYPTENMPQWKDVCPDSRWEGGPDYTEDRDFDR